MGFVRLVPIEKPVIDSASWTGRAPPPIDPNPPTRRLWMICFGECANEAWWTKLMRPGFRHVAALSWYADANCGVYVNPIRKGLVIDVLTDDEYLRRLAQLVQDSALILRVASTFERGHFPASVYCVGAIKALLGIKTRALWPSQLAAHLLAHGAEIVEVPRPEASVGSSPDTQTGSREREDHADAQGRTEARRGRPDQCDARAVAV